MKLWDITKTRTSIDERTYRPAGRDLVDNSGEPNYYAPSFLDRFVNRRQRKPQHFYSGIVTFIGQKIIPDAAVLKA